METYVFAELIPDYWNVKDAALSARSAVDWPEKLCATTPLLLMHGTADWRVHPSGSMRMAEALFELQRPFRLIMYEGSLSSFSPVVESERTRQPGFLLGDSHWPELGCH